MALESWGAFRRGRVDAVVREDPRRADGLECGELQIKVLFQGGNPRVPDHSHGRPRILSIPDNLPL
jgi:hypothetical protein